MHSAASALLPPTASLRIGATMHLSEISGAAHDNTCPLRAHDQPGAVPAELMLINLCAIAEPFAQ